MALNQLFTGDSEMARRMREHDWSATPLGPTAHWPLALRSPLDICLGSSFPIALYWGPQLTLLYNDAWSPILGSKHPWALGRPAQEVWPEIWDTIGPMFAQVAGRGQATRSQDQLLPMRRHGFTEECWFDYTFSPIRGDGGSVEGIFNAGVETTFRHIGERRTQLLRQLGEQTANAPDAETACERAAAAFAAFGHDLPFTLLFLLDARGTPRVAAASGWADAAAADAAAMRVPSAWPLAQALQDRGGAVAEALPARFGAGVPGGPWPEPCERALLLAFAASAGAPAGVLVAGISPRIALDDEYRAFVERAAATVGAAVAGAQANELQRKRAQALAEIDRAKTRFFTNVSHELRTPLTLMLGPLEDLHDQVASGRERDLVEIAQRNAQRLLKLVNTLLDFARVEGGRAQARFEPLDLATLTADLASTFRAACERAGLTLDIDCPPLPQPVYVDREQWERIVLNLLSNAFKFTLEGGIAVTLRAAPQTGHAQLTVRDTGCGIPPEQMGKLFQRFERIEGTRGRSVEGSGIGLALVQELVKLHGGTIEADSAENVGTCFTVRLPFGSAHLPAEHLSLEAALPRQPRSQAAAFVGEALQWLPSAAVAGDAAPPAADGPDRPRVLVADDNADLRAYIARLLGAAYAVRTASDGLEALSMALEDPPDLVVSDVMMPGLDGFELTGRLRADVRTRTLPVILLSARAGEEARVEGLSAGADDYLVKPFSARELQARVGAHLAAARIRREAEQALRHSEELLRTALAAAGAGSWTLDLATDRASWSPETYGLLGLDPAVPASTVAAMARVHPDDAAELLERLDEQLRGKRRVDLAFRVNHPQRGLRWLQLLGRRVENKRVLGIAMDVTERKAAELSVAESAQQLRAALGLARLGQFRLDLPDFELHSSVQCKAHFGVEPDAALPFAALLDLVHAQDRPRVETALTQAIDLQSDVDLEFRAIWPRDGSTHYIAARGRCVYGENGIPLRLAGVTQDVTDSRRAEQRLLLITDSVPGLISYIDARLHYQFNNKVYEEWFGLSRQAVRGRHVREVLGESSFEALRPRMEAALAGEAVHFEAQIPYLHGGSRHIQADYVPDVLADGSTAGFYVFVTDISERKRAELALLDARNELAEQVRDLTLLHDVTARLTADRELQPMFEQLVRAAVTLTHAPQAMLSRVDAERDELALVASAGFRAPYLKLVRRLPKGQGACGACFERRERVVVEDAATDPLFEAYRDAARVGGFRSAHATPLLARDGSVLAVLTLFKPQPGVPAERELRLLDLLTRHAAAAVEHLGMQQALRSSEQRFRTMADTAPAMLWVTDPNGALSFISRGWFEHTGQREEEAYAEGAGWTRMLHPDDRAPAAKAFEQAAQRREPFELEYRLRRADGSYRWAMDAGRPRWAEDGSWLGYIGSVIDVHDRTEAREGLREADRRKDEFLATLAHELRNPLAPIRNALQLLARGDSRSPTERVHAMLDRQVTHMVRLVDDLMEASRISRGQLELKREVLDLAEVLRAALEISRPLVERGRHDLRMALADEPLPVDGDGVRLAQVFSNLLNNAAKYTDDGGRIEIEARREGASVHVSIRDNGIGIAADQLPRLFEMFAQIDPTQARRHGGLGIGLSLAQRLVQMHGGTLQAASEGRGRGSVFSVRLPLAPGSAAPAPRPAVAGDVTLGRVLVVDDNVDAADTLGMLLRLLGAEVRVEHDGAMALRAAQEWQPAVVLLDLGMPGMDGFEVARRLRAESRLPRPTLIALTGWGQADVRRRTSLEGFDHHLIKPVDVDELHALLASLHDDAPTRVVLG